MLNFKKHINFLFVILLIFCLSNCGKDENNEKTSYSQETAKLITHITSQFIKSNDVIRVKFIKPIVNTSFIGKELKDKLFYFTPSIKGTSVWVDKDTLEFKPSRKLKAKTKYNAKLDLNKTMKNSYTGKKYQPVKFSFEVVPKEVLSINGKFQLIDKSNPKELCYDGIIKFSETVQLDSLVNDASIKLNNKKIKVEWSEGRDNSEFYFKTIKINRTNKKQELKITIDKNNLDISKKIIKKIPLESLSTLGVLGITPVYNGKFYNLMIEFSDELDLTKDITGLINIDGLDVRLKPSDNTVLVQGQFDFGKSYFVNIDSNIQSRWGTKLVKNIGEEVKVEYEKPEMSFSSDGVFLPTTNNQVITFRTMNLKRVRLNVMKVFENNLGQFLQTEKLSSKKERKEEFYYEYVYRVGVVVFDDILEIGDTSNKWLQHEIDLKNLIIQSEKGFYLLSISFQKDDMIYNFKDKKKNSDDDYYYYDESSYYTDPNSYGYIYAHGRIYKPVIQSDIGLVYKMDRNKHTVFATDIITSEPKNNVEITLKTYQNQLIATKKTDSSGKAEFNNNNTDIVFYIEANTNDQRSVIKLNEMEWNKSAFDTNGTDIDFSGICSYIYTERGVYRPGDEINFSLIARNDEESFPKDHPVILKIYNPKKQLMKELTNKSSTDGFYAFNYKTKEADLTGNWEAQFDMGSKIFYHIFKIETIVPYKLKVEINADKENLTRKDKNINITVNSKYLMGNPSPNLASQITATINNETKKFSGYPGFIFDNETIEYKPVSTTIFDGNLDENGNMQTSYNLPSFDNSPSGLRLNLYARVLEKGGRAVIRSLSIPVDPYDFYVGLQKPNFNWGYAVIGEPININTILVDRQGSAISGQKLKYKIYKNNSYWWWQYDNYDSYKLRFKTDSSTQLLDQGNITTGNKPEIIKFNPKDRGQYFVEVEGVGENPHTTGFFFYAYYWGESTSTPDSAGIMILKKDKDVYNPGDVAKITFPAPEEGNVLVSIEKNSLLLETKWYKVNNKSKEMEIPVNITKTMMPNIYVSVLLIQPHSQTKNDRPIRMYGIIPLVVEDPVTKETLIITSPDSIKPNEEFNVEIQTSSKTESQFTIAVVDEGLLDLTNFKTPDPWKAFYEKQMLNVRTYDLYDFIISANKGDIFKRFSIGGDLEDLYRKEQMSPKEVKRFEPVCLFKGPLYTDKQGYAKVSFKMPEYIGSVRIMAVSVKNNKYGSKDKTMKVKNDLMVLPTLPRVIGPEDSFVVPVSVFVMNENIKNVNVSIKVQGPLVIDDKIEKSINFSKTGDKDISFKLRALNKVGEAKIIIEAKSDQGIISQDVTNIAVRPSSQRIFESETKIIVPGENVSIKIPDKGIEGTNRASLTISRFQKLNMDHRLRWLIHYPYGCIEQTTSSVFPQLYLKDIIKESDVDGKNIDTNINAGIERLRSFQLSSGGFTYWPGNIDVSVWGTNYAGHFLLEAKRLGYNVPDSILKNWIEFQKSMSLKSIDDLRSRIYRLYLLALSGNAQIGQMNLIKENNMKDMDDAEKWTLAAGYKLAGQDNAANALIQKLGTATSFYYEMSNTYGSGLRDKAMILEMMILFKKWDKGYTLFNEILNEISGNYWYSTQTVGYMLLACGKYIKDYLAGDKKDKPLIDGYFVMPNGTKIEFNTDEIMVKKPINTDFGKDIKIVITKKTTVPKIFITLEWDGIPLKSELDSLQRNMILEVEYFDETGIKMDPKSIKQGTVFWGHFRIIRQKDVYRVLEELALVQILPSGWEIENTRVTGENIPTWMSNYSLNREEYVDIRDDRIMWFFDMDYSTKYVDFIVKFNAVTVGKFFLPSVICEAMYNSKEYKAVVPGKDVEVLDRNSK